MLYRPVPIGTRERNSEHGEILERVLTPSDYEKYLVHLNGKCNIERRPSADKDFVDATSFTNSGAVLIVDDDPWFRSLTRKHLESSGFHVMEAESAAEGFKVLLTQPVDLMVVDIMMPETPGFVVIADAKQQFPGVKILAVSGIGTENGYLRAAHLIGADATLEKPFTADILQKSVRFLLS